MALIQRARRLLRRNRTSIRLATRNAVVVSAGLAAAKLLAFVYATLLARAAGAETFGEFTLFITIFVLISEVPGAFDTIYIRFANAPDSSGDADHYLMSDLYAKVSYLLVVVIGGWLFAPTVAGLFDKPDSIQLIQYAVIAGAVYCLYLLLIASFQRQHRFVWVSIFRVVFPATILLGVLGFAAFSDDEISSIEIAAVFSAIAGFLGFAAAVWIVSQGYRSTRVSRDVFLRFLKVAGVLLLASTIGMVSLRLDVFILTSNLEFSELGQYGVALRISVLASFFTVTISTILVPKAVSALHDGKMFRRYLGLAAFYGVLQTMLALVVMFFMGQLVFLLFGESYEPAVPVGIILIIRVLLLSYGIPFKALIQAGPRPSYMIGITVLRLIVGFMLLSWWVPEFGLLGAAAAITVVEVLITVVMIAAALASRRAVHRLNIAQVRGY